MKNEQEIKNQMEVLKSLDNALDNYDQKIDELLNTKDLEESLRKCEPKKGQKYIGQQHLGFILINIWNCYLMRKIQSYIL